MRSKLLASVAVAHAAAFFNTNSGSKLFICATPQDTALDRAGYEALAWVQVRGVGSLGETGSTTNILTYDTWDDDVVQKAKGMTDAGSPEIELARNPTDPGQIILRAACDVNRNYAFRVVRNDATNSNGTGTVRYNRGLVVGPRQPNGRNEDFDLEAFTLGLQQRQITVDPTAPGVAPLLTAAPAITGTPKVNNVMTASTGTFTGDATITYAYQWFAGGMPISGANGNNYIPVTADIGKVLTVRVIATNASGTAQGTSAPTAVVAA